jgi:hypothetical protein
MNTTHQLTAIFYVFPTCQPATAHWDIRARQGRRAVLVTSSIMQWRPFIQGRWDRACFETHISIKINKYKKYNNNNNNIYIKSVVLGRASKKYAHCAVIGSVFCHSWGHYVIAKCMSLARVDIQHFCPFGLAIELYYKFPSKKAQGYWPQIKGRQITLYLQ